MIGRPKQTGLKRRRLRSPGARARARQWAAFRAWCRQRGSTIAVVLLLLAPFGLMGAITGIRVAFGASPVSAQGRTTFGYAENALEIIDPGLTVTDDPPATEQRKVTGFFTSTGPINNPTSARMFVQSGVGPITVVGTQVFHGSDQIATVPTSGLGSGNNAGPLIVTLGASITITDTMIQDLMRAITYEDTSEDPITPTGPGFRTIELQIIDPVDGDGPPMTYTINSVTQVNDPPILTAPPETLAVNDDTDLSINTPTASAPVTVSDLDSGSTAITIVTSVPGGQGALTMSNAGSCSIAGSGTNSITLSAPQAAASPCLATLVYRSPPAFSGAVTLTVNVNDNGALVGGTTNVVNSLTDAETITINVTSVNDPPVLTVPVSASVIQYQTVAIGAIGLADSDADAAIMQVNLSVTKGTLSVGSQIGLTTITGDGTNSVVMTGTRVVLDASLDSITYTATATSGNLNDVLTVVANDLGNTGAGGPQTDTETVALTVSEFNDLPVITSPASVGVTEDVASPVAGISLADPDANPASDAVQMSLSVNQGTLTLGTTTGLTFGIGDGLSDGTMQFTGTQNDINAALLTLTYLTAPNANTNATLTLDANDQGFTGSPGPQNAVQKIVTLTVSGVNDAPTIAVPAAQTTNEDTALVFSSGGANLISVADPDAGASPVSVTLSVAQGTLSLNGVVNLTFTSGANGTGSMTFQGPLTDVNTALNGLSYQPNLNYLGADTLNLSADDLGNTGSGSPGTDSKTVGITVSAVNDAPVVTAPASANVTEDVPATISGVTVADVDAGSSPIQMTFSASSGTVSLTNTAGLTVVGGANGTSSVTFSGTLTAFNSVLGTLSYQTNSNSTVTDTLVVTANDQGNTGSGGPKTDTKNITINVGAVNDGPTIALPGSSFSTPEETALTINGTGVVVSDPDVGSLDVEVTLTVSHGTVTLKPGFNTAPPLASVSGEGTASVTLRGTLTNVNNALNSLGYLSVTNYVGPDVLTIVATDLGNTGSGGPLSDTKTINITVSAVNDAPVVTAPGSATVTEDVASAVSGLSLADVDAGSSPVLLSVSVGAGTVTFGSTSGLTVTGGANGTSSVSYSGTLANLNAALGTLTYLTASNSVASDALTIVVNDQGNTGTGGAQSDTKMLTLNVSAVNDAPNINNPGLQSGTEDVVLNISGLNISDVDANAGTIQVSLTAGFGRLTMTTLTGLAFATGDGTSDQTMTFTGTLTNVNNALATLQYLGNTDFNGNDSVQVAVNDQGNTGSGGAKSDTDSVPIFLNGTNDPPVLTVSSPQDATEDVDSPIGGISVADPDVGPTQIQITLSVTNGKLTLNTRTGLTFSGGADGVSDASMTFSGTLTNVNNALGSLIYRGNQDYNGADTLSVGANDLGNTGTGGAKTASGSITINVAAQNDGPEISLPSPQAPPEDTDFTIGGVGITVNDVDVGGGLIQVQLTVNHGVLTLSTTSGLSFIAGDGTQDATMTFQGTLTNVNNALHNLVYRGNPNFVGQDPLTIVAGDLGNTGAGGPKTDSDVLQIAVGEINDAPVVTVPGAQSVNEDTSLSIMGIGVADVDIGSSPMRVTVSAASGAISLGSTSGLSFSTGDGTSDATMTFTGTLSNVNAALAAIQYRGNQDFNGADTITVTANDQGATGQGGPLQDSKTIAVSVGAVNDAPVITLPGPIVTANSPAAVLVDSQATVTDVDSANFDGGTLTIAIVSGATPSDRLNIRDQGDGPGEVGISGNTASVGGTAVGTFSGEVSQNTPLVVALNANATPARILMLLRNVTFRLDDAEPNTSNRTVRFVLTDGDGGTSSPADKQVRVAPLADLSIAFADVPPVVNNLGEFGFTILVTNHGPLTATGVVMAFPLNPELNLRSAEPSKGSCNGGRTVTCQLSSVTVGQTVRIPIRVYNTNVNTYNLVATVTGTSDDPNTANNRATASIWAAGENPPGDEKDKEDERRRKLTEERRQQNERTNQHGLDDYRTEGNVIEVNFIVEQPFAVVAMRDGPQRILLPCKGGCPDVRVGDYLEADGVKENEQLFYAENVTLTRNGKKVKP
ncbi:MAG: hypothetical protein IT306_28750 [Chloroflexi bacterium]|nr:hypothetical protein [Chloroflexota bacterium]